MQLHDLSDLFAIQAVGEYRFGDRALVVSFRKSGEFGSTREPHGISRAAPTYHVPEVVREVKNTQETSNARRVDPGLLCTFVK